MYQVVSFNNIISVISLLLRS